MSEKPKDPMDALREFIGQWERGVNEFANKAMGNEQFSQAMHSASSVATGARARVSEAMEKYLATINMPSRADITSIGERLQSIEAQLERLTEIVAILAGPAATATTPTAPKPRRGRQPPRKKEGRP